MRQKLKESPFLRWIIGLVILPLISLAVGYIVFTTTVKAHIAKDYVHISTNDRIRIEKVDNFLGDVKIHAMKINKNEIDIAGTKADLKAIQTTQGRMYDALVRQGQNIDEIKNILLSKSDG